MLFVHGAARAESASSRRWVAYARRRARRSRRLRRRGRAGDREDDAVGSGRCVRARARLPRTDLPGLAGSEVQLSFAALGDLLEDVLDETLSELPRPQRRALEVALLLEDPQGLATRPASDRPRRPRSVSPSSPRRGPCSSPSTTCSGWMVRARPSCSSRPAGLRLRAARRSRHARPGGPEDVLDLERALPVERLRLGPLNASVDPPHRPLRSSASLCRALCLHTRARGESRQSLPCASSSRGRFDTRRRVRAGRARSSLLRTTARRAAARTCWRSCSSSRCWRIRRCQTVRSVVADADESLGWPSRRSCWSGPATSSGSGIRCSRPRSPRGRTTTTSADSSPSRSRSVVDDPRHAQRASRARRVRPRPRASPRRSTRRLTRALARGAPSAAAELLELAIGLTPSGRERRPAPRQARGGRGALQLRCDRARDGHPRRAARRAAAGEERAEVLVRLARGTHDLERDARACRARAS